MAKTRAEKTTGTEQYASFMKRIARSYGRKAVAGELGIEALEQLVDVQAMLDEQIAEVVRALRSEAGGSHSWAEVASALGITRAAAYKRYGGSEDAGRRPGGQPSELR